MLTKTKYCSNINMYNLRKLILKKEIKMKKKLTIICSFIFCVILVSSFAYASTYTDIMTDLNSIYSDAESLNAEYEMLLTTYAAKISSIAHATEAQNLADHIMQEN